MPLKSRLFLIGVWPAWATTYPLRAAFLARMISDATLKNTYEVTAR
jgi:hypothetical protein